MRLTLIEVTETYLGETIEYIFKYPQRVKKHTEV